MRGFLVSAQKPDNSVKVGILGASGNTIRELIRLIANHPYLDISLMSADRKAGQSGLSVFPHLISQLHLPDVVAIKDTDFSNVDAVFCCLRHGTTQEIIKGLPTRLKIVDLSADFRLRDINDHEEWYSQPHKAPELQKEAIYGLTEIYRNKIQSARFVANPGCYPTSILLPVIPLLKAGLVALQDIVIVSHSGISGAGYSANEASPYTFVSEGISSYGITGYCHVPEIEQELSVAANSRITVSFTSTIIPINRGILSNINVQMAPGVSVEDLKQHLKSFYENGKFVKVLPGDLVPCIDNVLNINGCHMNIFPDRLTGKARIISAIDNLVKGASGQAIQNLNLMMGFPENTGLSGMSLVL